MQLQAICVYSVQGACRVDAGKFTCFRGKLQVTHLHCVWRLFTCSPQLNLHAFGGNFARVRFTV